MADSTPHTRRALMTLAFAFILGTCISSFVAWWLVPAQLSVEYLTPVTLTGPFVGLIVGAVLLRLLPSTHSQLH